MKKKYLIILVTLVILILFFVRLEKKENFQETNYNLEGSLSYILLNDFLNKTDDFKKSGNLYSIEYDIKYHIFESIKKLDFKTMIYKRKLLGYKMTNEKDKDIYIFSILPERMVKENSSDLNFPYLLKDYKNEEFFTLIIVNKEEKEELSKYLNKNTNFIKIMEKKDINNKKILTFLEYLKNIN